MYEKIKRTRYNNIKNNMENKDFELIEKYLLGKMSEEERQLFEERLAFDADLREEKEHMEEYILAIEYDHLKEAVESYRILGEDRKSTRLNSSHVAISYAVF